MLSPLIMDLTNILVRTTKGSDSKVGQKRSLIGTPLTGREATFGHINTMKVEIHEDLSLTTKLFNAFVMPLFRLTRQGRCPISPKVSQALKPTLLSGCDWMERRVEDVFVYEITAKGMTSKPTKRVL